MSLQYLRLLNTKGQNTESPIDREILHVTTGVLENRKESNELYLKWSTWTLRFHKEFPSLIHWYSKYAHLACRSEPVPFFAKAIPVTTSLSQSNTSHLISYFTVVGILLIRTHHSGDICVPSSTNTHNSNTTQPPRWKSWPHSSVPSCSRPSVTSSVI